MMQHILIAITALVLGYLFGTLTLSSKERDKDVS